MKSILPDYEINEKTMALLPAFHHEYDTIVLEPHRKLYVKQTALQLIEKAAIRGGSDYKGRRNSIIHLLGIKKKIPIPINPAKNIYIFPTHSPNNMHCCWIFFHHVYRIKKSSTSSPAIRSIIIYKNGQELAMKESASILEKQLFRTWLCIKTLNGDGPSYSLQMEG